MNNDEAKFILSAYRPGGEDAGNAAFAEALSQAAGDPDLARWFEEERRFDSAMSDALRTVPVPRDLQERILSGGKISRPNFSMRRRGVLALAALLLALAVLGAVVWPRAARLDRWQQDALALIPTFSTGENSFDLEGNDPTTLQRWLQAKNAPAPAPLPTGLKGLDSIGCKTFRSGAQLVSLICFHLPNRQYIHLVVTDRATLSRPPPAQARFARLGNWRTASWSANGRAYMLATTASESELRNVLQAGAQARLTNTRTL